MEPAVRLKVRLSPAKEELFSLILLGRIFDKAWTTITASEEDAKKLESDNRLEVQRLTLHSL